MPLDFSSLPIAEILPRIAESLSRANNLVIQAPPGAGKTTTVPIVVAQAPWCKGKVLMLEPRRLAARAAATRMADLLGEEVGETVGYRVRLEKKIGPKTRIEVVTEGILTRLLQDDPALEGISTVIFDEIHERNLNSDVGLALCLDIQANLRDDLRLIAMSATLDAQGIAKMMDDAPVITSAGKAFPVAIQYCESASAYAAEAHTTAVILRAIKEAPGDILVFLPGQREIQRVETALRAAPECASLVIAPLYGDLGKQQQLQAILPAPDRKRKIVLSTNIAETSLTIEGVRIVVDSGQMRVSRFDPSAGMARLSTIRVSQASADQRAGRAGRLDAGVCYRLWGAETQKRLLPYNAAEIEHADLSALVLEMAHWGVADIYTLRWLTPPPAAHVAQAQTLLTQLQALDDQGRITAHGRAMQRLGFHPRLAHMMLAGKARGQGYLACLLAALLNERDILRDRAAQKDSDIATRVQAWRAAIGRERGATDTGIDRGACFQIKEQADSWARQLDVARTTSDDGNRWLGILAAHAYPDRIAKRRGGSEPRYLLANGRGAFFSTVDAMSQEPLIVVTQLDAGEREARIFLAATLDSEQFFEEFADQIEMRTLIEWDDKTSAVIAKRVWKYRALILREQPLLDIPPEARAEALLQGIRKRGISVLPWTEAQREWQSRVGLLHRSGHVLREESAAWPDVSDEALIDSIEHWLAPFLDQCKQIKDITAETLQNALNSLLTWRQQQALETLAPTHLEVASGSRIRLDYRSQDRPVLAVRLQEMFGERTTPAIVDGKVPVILHLLSPAMRVAQITEDLAGFWANTYNDVKKDLKARYPKHAWPDDPLTAPPTARARRRDK